MSNADFDTIATAYGCSYGMCDFCPNAKMFGPGVLARPVDCVVEDIANRPGRHICITDPDFAARPELRQLAPRLARRGKSFSVASRLDSATRPDVMEQLREMGVTTIKLGIETFSDTLLREMGKGQTALQIINSIEILLKAGFHVFGYLLIGSPGETCRTLLETLAAVEHLADRVSWLPNIFCDDLSVEAHHYSRPQARKLGLCLEIVDRFFDLAV